MANIVIRDLDENAELDNAAMREILGGRPGHGLSSAQDRALAMTQSPLQNQDDFLPKIGLGVGFLGSVGF
ncbi:MAG: hypothetical protein AAFZ58_01870 [Pseudomonadota bacterium]